MDKDNAASGLAAVARIRGELAGRARWSLAHHAAFGLVMAVMVGAWSLPPPLPLLVVGACLGATALIAAQDRKRDGMFISGYQRGKTLPVTLAILGVSVSALVAGVFLRVRMGLVWAPALLGIATFAICTGGSILWERRYRRQLADHDT